MLITPANLQLLFTMYNAAYARGLARVQPAWQRIATLVPSSTETNLYPWLGQFPKMREWIGDRHLRSMAAQGYQLTNKPYESTIEVPRPKILDDQYGIYTPMFEQMGYAGAIYPDEQLYSLLPLGISTPCYDGQFFFDTDHPVGKDAAVSVSNVDSGGGGNFWYLMVTNWPLKPMIFQERESVRMVTMTNDTDTPVFMRNRFLYGLDGRGAFGFGFWQQAYASNQALDSTHFTAARQAMLGFKSDEGRPLGMKPDLLVVGASNVAAGEALILAANNANGSSNTNYKSVDLYVCPWLP